jgi:aldehyde dehydrogenase (NAD+)
MAKRNFPPNGGHNNLRKALFVGAKRIDTPEFFVVRNPSDCRDVVAEVACARPEDVEEAILSAREALKTWKRMSIIERARILQEAGRVIQDRFLDIAQVISREIGKLLREALKEVRKSRDFFEYYGGFGRLPVGTLLAQESEGSEVVVRKEPRGVVGIITPWNDPLLTVSRKLCPALVSGNSVLLKPAPEAPVVALLLAEILDEVGLPRGVLSVLTGPDDEVGKWLVSAEGIDAISFTGSTAVGLEIQKAAAGRNVAVQTEMGGKNTTVVLGDADMDAALEAIMDGAFTQAGQRCTATSRLLVSAELYDQLLAKLRDRIAHMSVGPATLDTSDMGPVISFKRRDELVHIVEKLGNENATVLCAGNTVEDGQCAYGSFMSPTLVGDVPLSSAAWSQELFGPVLAARSFVDLDEAIELVNGTSYGLSAALFSSNLQAVSYFASEVDVGCVAINLPTAGWDVHVPFGGFKMSGFGSKEQGEVGIDFYTRQKTVAARSVIVRKLSSRVSLDED